PEGILPGRSCASARCTALVIACVGYTGEAATRCAACSRWVSKSCLFATRLIGLYTIQAGCSFAGWPSEIDCALEMPANPTRVISKKLFAIVIGGVNSLVSFQINGHGR